MKRFLLITLLCHCYYFQFSQEVSTYRKTSDQFLNSHFDSIIAKKIVYKTFTLKAKNALYTEYGYKQNKSKIKEFDEVVFEYHYYSSQLKHTFTIFVPVTQTNIVSDTGRILKNIPECVIKSYRCELISRDSAIVISRHSKIAFPNNLSVTLENHERNNEFVWVVYGRNPNQPSNGGRGRATSNQIRYINALTGSIIDWNEYHSQ